MPIPNQWLEFSPKPKPLGPGQAWTVFLSYRSASRPWVMNLYDVLNANGHKVFLDQVVLRAGDLLIQSLEEGLKQSQAGVLVYSSDSGDSSWVRREYETMERRADEDPDFAFVPVSLDDTELPEFARNRIFLEFSEYPDGPNGGVLLRLLHAVVGKPLSKEAFAYATEQDEIAERANAQIRTAIDTGSKSGLLSLFETGGVPWETSASLGSSVIEGLTKLGAEDSAIEVAMVVEKSFPKAVRPRQLHALALARRGDSGDLDAAQEIMGFLQAEGHRDPETLGIYGRTWMDRFVASGDLLDLRRSRDLYAEAFDGARDDYYTGVNAAAKSVLLGAKDDLMAAKELATKVGEIVGTDPVPGDYWKTATVAEVLLIRGHFIEAAAMYGNAVAMAPKEVASHRSTFTQARRLMEKLELTDEERWNIEGAFSHL